MLYKGYVHLDMCRLHAELEKVSSGLSVTEILYLFEWKPGRCCKTYIVTKLEIRILRGLSSSSSPLVVLEKLFNSKISPMSHFKVRKNMRGLVKLFATREVLVNVQASLTQGASEGAGVPLVLYILWHCRSGC